jgi:hypothetical protein
MIPLQVVLVVPKLTYRFESVGGDTLRDAVGGKPSENMVTGVTYSDSSSNHNED